VVFVEFDGYSGPETPAWEGINPSWVPTVVPAVARWETKAGKTLICTQLPLMMPWGITIHKSQGLTPEKVVVKRIFLLVYLLWQFLELKLCKV
jgi:hypothetical protein